METKTLREYSLNKGMLNCTSYRMFTDDMDVSNYYPIYLSARVEPEDKDNPRCLRLRVQAHNELSPVALIEEIEYFLQTLKQMYAI